MSKPNFATVFMVTASVLSWSEIVLGKALLAESRQFSFSSAPTLAGKFEGVNPGRIHPTPKFSPVLSH
jgi:hypothetical protein